MNNLSCNKHIVMTNPVTLYQAIRKAIVAMGTPHSIMGGQTVSHRVHATL